MGTKAARQSFAKKVRDADFFEGEYNKKRERWETHRVRGSDNHAHGADGDSDCDESGGLPRKRQRVEGIVDHGTRYERCVGVHWPLSLLKASHPDVVCNRRQRKMLDGVWGRVMKPDWVGNKEPLPAACTKMYSFKIDMARKGTILKEADECVREEELQDMFEAASDQVAVSQLTICLFFPESWVSEISDFTALRIFRNFEFPRHCGFPEIQDFRRLGLL